MAKALSRISLVMVPTRADEARILAPRLLERQCLAGRRRDMGDVQGHRDDVVIAVHRDQIHDAVLAELLDRLAIERVVHFVVAPKLRGEFPDDRLIVLHLLRLPAGAERCDDLGIETRLDRERGVRVHSYCEPQYCAVMMIAISLRR